MYPKVGDYVFIPGDISGVYGLGDGVYKVSGTKTSNEEHVVGVEMMPVTNTAQWSLTQEENGEATWIKLSNDDDYENEEL